MSALQKTEHRHSHMWMVGVLGMIAGAGLMVYVPSLKSVSNVIFLFALFHILGAVVLLASFYMTGGKQFLSLSVAIQAAVPSCWLAYFRDCSASR